MNVMHTVQIPLQIDVAAELDSSVRRAMDKVKRARFDAEKVAAKKGAPCPYAERKLDFMVHQLNVKAEIRNREETLLRAVDRVLDTPENMDFVALANARADCKVTP